MSSENPNLPRVSIAVPSGSMVHATFAMCLANLAHASAEIPLQLVSSKSSIVAVARNNAVQIAKDWGAAYLLFLDSDMEFPPATLVRLLLHGQDIVGATYVRRVAPYKVIGAPLATQPAERPAGLVEMASIPTGCLLVRMSVFDTMPKPIFRFGVAGEHIVSEDFQFCADARRAGHRVWCDAALSHEIGHIGEKAFHLDGDEMSLGAAAPSPPA